MLAGVVRGAMACLSALGGTTRSQCVSVEEACLHVLDSPHAQVRKVPLHLSFWALYPTAPLPCTHRLLHYSLCSALSGSG